MSQKCLDPPNSFIPPPPPPPRATTKPQPKFRMSIAKNATLPPPIANLGTDTLPSPTSQAPLPPPVSSKKAAVPPPITSHPHLNSGSGGGGGGSIPSSISSQSAPSIKTEVHNNEGGLISPGRVGGPSPTPPNQRIPPPIPPHPSLGHKTSQPNNSNEQILIPPPIPPHPLSSSSPLNPPCNNNNNNNISHNNNSSNNVKLSQQDSGGGWNEGGEVAMRVNFNLKKPPQRPLSTSIETTKLIPIKKEDSGSELRFTTSNISSSGGSGSGSNNTASPLPPPRTSKRPLSTKIAPLVIHEDTSSSSSSPSSSSRGRRRPVSTKIEGFIAPHDNSDDESANRTSSSNNNNNEIDEEYRKRFDTTSNATSDWVELETSIMLSRSNAGPVNPRFSRYESTLESNRMKYLFSNEDDHTSPHSSSRQPHQLFPKPPPAEKENRIKTLEQILKDHQRALQAGKPINQSLKTSSPSSHTSSGGGGGSSSSGSHNAAIMPSPPPIQMMTDGSIPPPPPLPTTGTLPIVRHPYNTTGSNNNNIDSGNPLFIHEMSLKTKKKDDNLILKLKQKMSSKKKSNDDLRQQQQLQQSSDPSSSSSSSSSSSGGGSGSGGAAGGGGGGGAGGGDQPPSTTTELPDNVLFMEAKKYLDSFLPSVKPAGHFVEFLKENCKVKAVFGDTSCSSLCFYEFEIEDNEENIIFENDELVYATFCKLLQQLTHHKQATNALLISTFLLTYRAFFDPLQLLELLIFRFYGAPPSPSSSSGGGGDDDHQQQQQHHQNWKEKSIQIKQRVLVVLMKWIDKFYEKDFMPNGLVMQLLAKWLDDQDNMPKELSFILDVVKRTIGRNVMKKKVETDYLQKKKKPPKPHIPKSSVNNLTLTDIHPTEIARQLAIIEKSIFDQIGPAECLRQGWAKEGKESNSPNIYQMIKRFNIISNWVASEILKVEDVKERAVVLNRFIIIAEESRALSNYNAVMEILAGLQSAPIYRLKNTWSMLPAKTWDIWDNLNEIMSNEDNFTVYRNTLKTSKPPCLPYIGIYLTDLVFVEDGNLDWKPNTNLINIVKLRFTASIMFGLDQFQQKKYHLIEVPAIQQYLSSPPYLPEDKLKELSLKIEPRQ